MEINRDFMITKMDGKIYLTNGKRLFTTNLVGAQILRAISNKKTETEIVEILSKKYNADITVIKNDVQNIIEDFKTMGIVF